MSSPNFFNRGWTLIVACIICLSGCAVQKQLTSAEQPVNKAPQSITFNALESRTYGDADFSPDAEASSGLSVSYTSTNTKVAVVVDNQIHIVGAGSSTIIAVQAGDANYRKAEPIKQTLTVNKARATVTLTNLEQTYDGKAKKTAAKTEPDGLGVTLTYDNKSAAPVNAGAYTVVGMVTDANYEGSTTGTLTIARAAQSITLNALATRTYGDGSFTLASTVTSGLTATYESANTSVATMSGSKVRIAGAGTVVITAFQAGDSNHLPAEPVRQALTVNKARASVTLAKLEQIYDGTPKLAEATTGPRGLNVILTYDNNAAAPINAGTYTVVGTIREINYEGSATGTLSIARARQSISFDALAAHTYGEAPFTLAATVTSGLTATYESANTAVASVSGSEVRIAGAGRTEITAYQGGDGNHLPAVPVRRVLTVNKAAQKISFDALAARTYTDPPFGLTSTLSSGLTASYESANAAVATISGSEVKIIGAGTAVITAVQQGDDNYLPAEPVRQALTVNKAPQSITFNALPATAYGNETPYLLFASASSGLTATYDSSDSAVATINGNAVKIMGAGTVMITAYQSGDKNYLPAKPIQRALTVEKAHATVIMKGIDQTYSYDRKPKPVQVTTIPAGLTVNIAYDGNTAAPVDAGRYGVTAEVQDANYEGSTTGTITIAKASQKIRFPVPGIRTEGGEPFDLPAVLSSGLPAAYVSSNPRVATVSGSRVTIRGAGTATITALQEGDRNYEPAEPVVWPLIVRGQKPRIIVFPMENLSGRPAPVKEIRASLVDTLVRQGKIILDDDTMQQFMVRHRVRYTGGVDTSTALAWKAEAGMEAVLVTSVDQYDDSEVPKITLTSRLVSTGEMPYILWMETISLSGDDAPGLFGSGLIGQIGPLQNKAVKQLMDSLAAFYADRVVLAAGKDQGTQSFKPKKVSRIPFLAPDKTYTVAVMPFYNKSKSSKAGEILALRFVRQMVKNKSFLVLEPGIVRQKLLNFRTIMLDGPSKEDMQSFFINVGADLVLMGRVMEYQEGSPKLEFEVQVYDGKSGSMAWTSWSYNEGNDAVVAFNWQRVINAGDLASKMAKSVVMDMIAE
jgi:hypothetical protein